MLYPGPGLRRLINDILSAAGLRQHKVHVQILVKILRRCPRQIGYGNDFRFAVLVFLCHLVLARSDVHVMQRVLQNVLHDRRSNHAPELNAFGIVHCRVNNDLRIVGRGESDKGYDMLAC
ncbi:hypothetical protein D3C76_1579610 [compost metagenome]